MVLLALALAGDPARGCTQCNGSKTLPTRRRQHHAEMPALHAIQIEDRHIYVTLSINTSPLESSRPWGLRGGRYHAEMRDLAVS